MRDAESFDDFYRGTSRRLMRYAYALTGDMAEAQDLVQEAYIRAWQRWGRLSGYESVDAWLRLVVTRLATDRWRRRVHMRAALTRSGPPEHAGPPGDETVMLVSALRRLPKQLRRALALHYLYDMSIDEIAVETGAASGTVKSWLSRGRAALAEVLAGEASEVK